MTDFWGLISLYSAQIYYFSCSIKSKKPPPETSDERTRRRIFDLLERLKKRAKAGNEKADEELRWIRWRVSEDFREDIEQKAKAGKHSHPPPIRTLFEHADWAIRVLFWLSQHQSENIKKYVRVRWSWPGHFHMLKREQNKFQSLMPRFNRTGTKIAAPGPIGLGSALPLKPNANLTKGGYLFLVAANAIRMVTRFDEFENPLLWVDEWWLRAINKNLRDSGANKFKEKSKKFFKSLGKCSRERWDVWKPVFDTYLTWHYAPPQIKHHLIPNRLKSNLYFAFTRGTHSQWFEDFKKSKKLSAAEETRWLEYFKQNVEFYKKNHVILQDLDYPDVQAAVSVNKTEIGKWNALKKEIMKRIERLIPD